MEAAAPKTGIAEGYEALASGEWEVARAAFESALSSDEFPEALDGLGRTLWWLRESEQAVVFRERAYSGFRRDGELARAARIALWLSREYALVWGNEARRRSCSPVDSRPTRTCPSRYTGSSRSSLPPCTRATPRRA